MDVRHELSNCDLTFPNILCRLGLFVAVTDSGLDIDALKTVAHGAFLTAEVKIAHRQWSTSLRASVSNQRRALIQFASGKAVMRLANKQNAVDLTGALLLITRAIP